MLFNFYLINISDTYYHMRRYCFGFVWNWDQKRVSMIVNWYNSQKVSDCWNTSHQVYCVWCMCNVHTNWMQKIYSTVVINYFCSGFDNENRLIK